MRTTGLTEFILWSARICWWRTSIARDAADAGIYVGQSENVVIRRNRSEYNVDGYEIENSENVDAYENVATHNTGGMGVFNLPNLPRQDGKHVRVFNNQIIDNNTTNFAPKSLGPIHDLPTGTGIYVMAIKEVEAFGNKIQGNGTVNVFLMNYNTGVSPDSLAENRGVADYADGFQAGRHAILSLHAADIFSRQRYFGWREIAGFADGHDQGTGDGAGRVAAGYSVRWRGRSEMGAQGRQSGADLLDEQRRGDISEFRRGGEHEASGERREEIRLHAAGAGCRFDSADYATRSRAVRLELLDEAVLFVRAK